MKVKHLINQLERLPKNLQVYWADHDHGTFETGGMARYAELIDKSEITPEENDLNDGISNPFKGTPNRYVVIRP